MRTTKASKKRESSKGPAAKRATSRRTTTSRSRTTRTARKSRRVSAKSIPPVAQVELPKLLGQPAANPPLSSRRYPIQNLLVLFLGVAATGAVGGWAVYVALFGETRQGISAAPPPVVVDVTPSNGADIEVTAPKQQDQIAAAPPEEAISPIAVERQDVPPPLPPAPEVAAANPETGSAPASAPIAIPGPPVAGPGPATRAPVAAKGNRRGHPEAAAIAPTGPGGGAYAFVAEARRYLGTNPTGRRDLWCGAFVDLVLKRLGYKGGGNLASAYARYGTRVPGPQIGAIAVMTRVGGGHVGIVSGFDKKGRPIIISGNYKRRVAEVVYPTGRIYAYVIPKDWGRATAQTH